MFIFVFACAELEQTAISFLVVYMLMSSLINFNRLELIWLHYMRSLLDCESFVCRQNWYDTITHSNRSDFGCIFRLLLLCALHSNCMWLCNWYNSSGIYYIYSRMNFDNGSKRWLMIYECDTFNSYSGSFMSFVWLYLRNLHSPLASIFSHIYS